MQSTTMSLRSPAKAVVNQEAERHWRGGIAHALAGRWKDAEKAYSRATKIAPGESLFCVNLGQSRRKLGDLDGASAAVESALQVAPGDTLATQLRVAIRMERHRYEDAVDDARRVAHLPGADHTAWFEYGQALEQADRHLEAISALLQSVARKPDYFEPYPIMCNAFARLAMNVEGLECIRTALALHPGWGSGLVGAIYHSLQACDWSLLKADLAALDQVIAKPDPQAYVPFMFLSAGVDAAIQRRIFTEFAGINFGAIEAMPLVLPADRPAGERLRIGYLSNDYHNHATSMLIARVFELHDRDRFETRLYSYGRDDGSALRRRIEASGDAFIDVSGLSDRETAQRIRADRIDVLIDLKGFTLNARTRVMAMRPAPIQVAYLGFPATMGAPFIDYAVVDPIVLPPEKADEFTERLAWLPDSYQANDRLRPVATMPSRADVGLPESGFVFCSFNQTYKIRPEVFDVWCRLLASTPGSVLWQLSDSEASKANLRREALARGIDPGRLVFARPVQPEHNLARIGLADLFLDTLPINAHTTASDALWVGVPLVTCRGNSFVGRVAASLLHAVGLPELVTDSLEDYEALARSIASDPARHAALKTHLHAARETAPLFDSLRTTRALEDLYLRMASRWRAGQPPDHLHAQRPSDAATLCGDASA